MEKKVIKIKFLDFSRSFDEKNCLFVRLLRKHFEVQFSDDADYVFYSFVFLQTFTDSYHVLASVISTGHTDVIKV